MRTARFVFFAALLANIAIACQPARIDVSLASQDAVANIPLSLNIQLKDESGRACPADRDYPIHLTATDSHGQPLHLSAADVNIPRFASSAVSSVTAGTAGLITVRATGGKLRPGIASVFVRPVPRGRSAQAVWLVPAASYESASEVTVVAHCSEGGAVSANGLDTVVVHAELVSGPLQHPVTLHFAHGRIDGWDGIITIPAGDLDAGVEVRSHNTAPVDLANLLSSSPVVRLDPSGPATCAGVEFISPVQYADLEFEAGQISYGEPVRLAVIFRDREYNQVPIDDPAKAIVQVLEGRQPSFTVAQIRKDGYATLICKPNWWGPYRFQLLDGSLKTLYRGQGNQWAEGPVALSVTFPWIPFWSCILFGSAGALLLALYRRELEPASLVMRIVLGVGAAILLVSVTLQASLLRTDFTPYTLLILSLSFVAGWCGPAVFNWYARRLEIEPPSLEPAGTRRN